MNTVENDAPNDIYVRDRSGSLPILNTPGRATTMGQGLAIYTPQPLVSFCLVLVAGHKLSSTMHPGFFCESTPAHRIGLTPASTPTTGRAL